MAFRDFAFGAPRSPDVREGFAVRRQTADRVLQQLARVSFRFPHFYRAVMRGVWCLERNKGGVCLTFRATRII
jgi:hypothetical protein